MTRKFGGKNDEKFWSDKPIQPGHPKFKTGMSKAEEFSEKFLEDNNIDPNNVEYHHIIVMMEQYANEVSRDEYEKGFCDGKKARMGRHKNFWA